MGLAGLGCEARQRATRPMWPWLGSFGPNDLARLDHVERAGFDVGARHGDVRGEFHRLRRADGRVASVMTAAARLGLAWASGKTA